LSASERKYTVTLDEGRQKDVLTMLVAIHFAVVGWLPLVVLSAFLTADVILNEVIRRLDGR